MKLSTIAALALSFALGACGKKEEAPIFAPEAKEKVERVSRQVLDTTDDGRANIVAIEFTPKSDPSTHCVTTYSVFTGVNSLQCWKKSSPAPQ